MKLNKILILSIFLLAIFAVGAVSASEDIADSADVLSQDNLDEMEIQAQDADDVSEDESISAAQETSEVLANETGVQTYDIQYANFTYGDKQYVSLNLPENAAGNLTYNVDDIYFNETPVVNGTAKLLLPNLDAGRYTLILEYIGSDYTVAKVNTLIEVYPKLTYPSQMTIGEDKYFIIEGGSISGNAHIREDGYDEGFAVSGGIGKVSLSGLDVGEMVLSLAFKGDNGYDYYFDDINIDVLGVKPKLTGGSNIKMTYNSKATYKLTVYDVNKKPAEDEEVIIKIAGKVFEVDTNSKGVLSFNIPTSIAPGKYSIEASFNGVKVKNSLTINHLVKLSTVKVKKSAKKLVLKATLKNVKGKKVTFKFNGKKYTAKTDKKGVAKVTIKKSVLKKLKVGKKVTYQATYLKDTVKKTVKVKK